MGGDWATGREEQKYPERSRNDFIFKFELEIAQHGFFNNNTVQVRPNVNDEYVD